MSLPASMVEAFHRDGILQPLAVFTPDEVAPVADEVLELADAGIVGHDFPWHQKTYLLLPALDALLRDSRLTGAVAAIFGDDLLALSADIFIKPPGSTRRITWHQDVNYWHLDPYDMLTAWVALTPATVDNGCMRYARGGHLRRLAHIEQPEDDNMLTRGQQLAFAVRDEDTVNVELSPGQVSFHHALAPHASGPNLSDGPRVGFAIRYASTAVCQTAGPPISARLARGTDEFGHFDLESGPDAALSTTALRAHARALAPHTATGYATV